MINRIFHQIWLGNKPFPDEFKYYQDGLLKLHPDWEYKFWTDKDIIGLPVEDFIRQAKKNASKANVLRVYAVLEYGGVYADVDFEWNKNIDEFLIHDAFAVQQKIPAPHKYNNAIFGAYKGHEWVQWLYNNLHKYVDRNPPWGPVLFTDSMKLKWKDVVTLPTEYFYPYLWTQKNRPAIEFPNSYAVHKWAVTWTKE